MLQYLTSEEVRLSQQGLSQGAREEILVPAGKHITIETYTPPATASYVMSAGKTPFALQAFKAASTRGKWCHMQ